MALLKHGPSVCVYGAIQMIEDFFLHLGKSEPHPRPGRWHVGVLDIPSIGCEALACFFLACRPQQLVMCQVQWQKTVTIAAIHARWLFHQRGDELVASEEPSEHLSSTLGQEEGELFVALLSMNTSGIYIRDRFSQFSPQSWCC